MARAEPCLSSTTYRRSTSSRSSASSVGAGGKENIHPKSSAHPCGNRGGGGSNAPNRIACDSRGEKSPRIASNWETVSGSGSEGVSGRASMLHSPLTERRPRGRSCCGAAKTGRSRAEVRGEANCERGSERDRLALENFVRGPGPSVPRKKHEEAFRPAAIMAMLPTIRALGPWNDRRTNRQVALAV